MHVDIHHKTTKMQDFISVSYKWVYHVNILQLSLLLDFMLSSSQRILIASGVAEREYDFNIKFYVLYAICSKMDCNYFI